MTESYERRDLTEFRLRSTVFGVTAQVTKGRDLGVCIIEHDSGGTLTIPIADIPELRKVLADAHESVTSPENEPPAPPPAPASERSPGHPAWSKPATSPGVVIPMRRTTDKDPSK